MTARMYNLVPVSVMVSMKSAATSASACERRNCVQVVATRSGAGSIPAVRRISPYRGGGDRDPEGEQLPVHPPIAPRRVLRHQAQHQCADRADGAWPAPS